MNLNDRSQEAFAAYAALNSADLPTDELSAAQVLLYRWGIRNFGYEGASRYVLGLVEEASELQDALGEVEVSKELGDVLICAAQLCTCLRLDFGTFLNAASGALCGADPWTVLFMSLGDIARAVLKSEQRIRGMDDPAALRLAVGLSIFRICDVALDVHQDPREAFLRRASMVLTRDYINNPVDGGR